MFRPPPDPKIKWKSLAAQHQRWAGDEWNSWALVISQEAWVISRKWLECTLLVGLVFEQRKSGEYMMEWIGWEAKGLSTL